MTAVDWDNALARTRQRSTEFPLFERRSCKVFDLLDDSEQDLLMMHVTEAMNAYFTAQEMLDEVTDYTRHRVMTFLISRLGKCYLTF